MKSIPTSLLFVFLILCSPALISGQNIQLDDPFDDGDFTNNPTWDGTGSSFTIFEDSGNNQLQLNATDAGSSYLSTSSATAYGSWEFFIHLDFTTLSGSNNLTVFLTSNMADLFGEVSGYALQAGESGSGDVFTIVRYEDGSVVETVVTGTTNINDGGEFQVKAERSPDGTWILSVAEGYGSTPVQEATGADNEYNSSFYFGFRPDYTSTRTDLFYFDDIVITQAPIELTAMETVSNQEFQVTFTNELDAATVDPSDFSIDGIGNPEVISVYKTKLRLHLPHLFRVEITYLP
ncbi:MAG: hypothetical protein U5K69_05355 [Balneolaceae bacterium]|nr:hypothetical protein [Balneolaceae bacterium]